jgi:PAS domain S-box-containing protein
MTVSGAEIDGDEARRRLYDVMRDDGPFEERAERALEIGRRYLGVQNGHAAAVDRENDRWEAIVSTDGADEDFPPGLTVNLRTTYCRRVIRSDDPIALQDAPRDGWADDPAYETHGLRCYHGTVVMVDGEPFGTVCFVDEDPREEPFSDGETMFADLVARMLGHALEERRHQATVADHEREIREHREWLRSIVEASTDLIFRLDPEGRFTFVSDRVEDVLGYTPGDLQGEPIASVLPRGGSMDRTTDAFEAVAGGETAELADLPLSAADGERVYVDLHSAPVYAADGSEQVVALQGIVRDVTERRRKDRLVGILYRLLRHNLRNEMNVVSGLAEGIREQASGTAAEMADQIVATSNELVGLSGKAREMERYVDKEPTARPVDVVPCIEQAVEAIQVDYPDADVSMVAPNEAVATAAPALETAVLELVENAAKHAGDAPTVEVEVAASDDAVEVRVRDDGSGIPSQDRTVLQRGDQSPLHHGSGIGLWLVYWIVESIDADIAATVNERGTTVTITIPSAADTGEPSSDAA